MSKSKFTYPKCPWCKFEYKDSMCEYNLMNLTTKGWCTEKEVKCKNCGIKFGVTVHITYYGKKLKGEKHEENNN